MDEPTSDAEASPLSAEEHRTLAENEKTSTLDALAEGISHNVKTPLTVIQTTAYHLQARIERRAAAGTADAQQELDLKLIHRLVRSVERLTDVVNDLRHLSGMEPPQKAPESLNEVVAEAVELFEATAEEDVHVEATLDPAPMLMLDRSLIQLAVLNLLQNAAEATRELGGHIHVHTGVHEKGVPTLVVEDEGTGMPEEVQERVFDPLFTTRPGAGGLGLTVVKRILDEHEARIDLSSAPGRGARFVVQFAVASGDDAPGEVESLAD